MHMVQLSLCKELRARTKTAHNEIESHPYMVQLFRGRLPRAAWVCHLRDLVPVYEALDQALAASPRASTILSPALRGRAAHIVEDLAILGEDRGCPSDAARAYCERLDEVRKDPARLLGHAYTRHLGDLAGGQVIARTLARCFGDSVRDALSFHDFSPHGSPRALSTQWRAEAERISWTTEEIDRACDEARRAFSLNTSLLTTSLSSALVA